MFVASFFTLYFFEDQGIEDIKKAKLAPFINQNFPKAGAASRGVFLIF